MMVLMLIWPLLLTGLPVGGPASGREDLDDTILALLRTPNSTGFGAKRECRIVEYGPRRWARLEIRDPASGELLFRYRCFGCGFQRMFGLDLTRDLKNELVVEWFTGSVFTLTVFALDEPRLLFEKSYRHHASFEPDFLNYPYFIHIRVYSGGDNFGDVTIEDFVWSDERGEFQLFETAEIPRNREEHLRAPLERPRKRLP
jgi:hypothetical protein